LYQNYIYYLYLRSSESEDRKLTILILPFAQAIIGVEELETNENAL
jgi:hypothetical protein